jgi:sec-independent protein translocase protein TatA
MSPGPAEIGLIVLAVMLLFGYKKLPDASRSLGRSLRIFTSEVDELREGATATDDVAIEPAHDDARVGGPDAVRPQLGGAS